MITGIKIKEYANINHPIYEKGYWSSRIVSLGSHQNKVLDALIHGTGLEIRYDKVHSPYTQKGVLFMPPRENFENPSNYYHALIHEVMHVESRHLKQDKDLKKALDTYLEQTGQRPDIINIVSTIEKHGAAYMNAPENKPAKDVALAYLHQELKCEIVTIDILHKVGLRPDEKDLAHAKNIGRLAETIHNYAGLSIRENANNPTMLKEYNDLLNSVTKELKIEKTNDRER